MIPLDRLRDETREFKFIPVPMVNAQRQLDAARQYHLSSVEWEKKNGRRSTQVVVDEIKTVGRQAGRWSEAAGLPQGAAGSTGTGREADGKTTRGEDRGAVVGCLVVDELQ